MESLSITKLPAERAELQLEDTRPVIPLDLYSLIKRGVDLSGASLLIFITTPLMVMVYCIIKLRSPGPAFIRQKRLTIDKTPFTLYKFRTMRLDAEATTGPVMAAKNDPRIIPMGNFFRKARLDELPQLLNIIKGEMSLVGPRPERPEIASRLSKDLKGFDKRTGVKAGLTGLAQVEAGYCETVESYKKKLAFDLLYVRKKSILLDFIILFKTISVVFLGKGAR